MDVGAAEYDPIHCYLCFCHIPHTLKDHDKVFGQGWDFTKIKPVKPSGVSISREARNALYESYLERGKALFSGMSVPSITISPTLAKPRNEHDHGIDESIDRGLQGVHLPVESPEQVGDDDEDGCAPRLQDLEQLFDVIQAKPPDDQ